MSLFIVQPDLQSWQVSYMHNRAQVLGSNYQHRVLPHAQTTQERYAASKESFNERIKEELDPRIIEAPLTRRNYKKRFHNMICWEEKRHIEILENK